MGAYVQCGCPRTDFFPDEGDSAFIVFETIAECPVIKKQIF